VLRSFGTLPAVIGLALTALSLTGSPRNPATPSRPLTNSSLAEDIRRSNSEGTKQYDAGGYFQARNLYVTAATLSERAGDWPVAAKNWNNAGASALARLDYRDALADFLKARQAAQTSGQFLVRAVTMNNLASLYLQLENPDAALQIAKEALAGPAGSVEPATRPRLQFVLAKALARLHRFDEAQATYWVAVDELEEQSDLDGAARILASLGIAALEANRLNDAENALSEALLMIRLHHLGSSGNVLRGLAEVKGRRGDLRSAAALFDAAIDAPQGLTARWLIYADRGEFRLDHGDVGGAWADFLEARRLAASMRADVVPADQDRVSMENGLSRIGAGLVDAGNRLAQTTSDHTILKATFDAAEQDRLWSLRALVPASNDWRTRLPETYWDLLARYQSVERAQMAQPSGEGQKQASALQVELQAAEANAAGNADPFSANGFVFANKQSALEHVKSVLDADSVLLSFHVMKSSAWVWAVDRKGVGVYNIPAVGDLKSRVETFALATRQGDPRAIALGSQLYNDLLGSVPPRYLAYKRWLLELDGPLFDLPFASLVVGTNRKNEPIYLIERAALQSIPGALMLKPWAPAPNGEFLGIGDPVYNAADARYKGNKNKNDVMLPRLPATAAELQACSRAWGAAKTRILTGEDANLATVQAALQQNPSIIHFATHVVASAGNYSSGLIALSLDRSGALGLMGPTEIVAHPLSASLVVLNGCHSGQGEALPSAGLMGLTRAWIGAGSTSVLATRWDIPDEAGKAVMVEFYRASRAHSEQGPAFALQQAQLAALKEHRSKENDSLSSPAIWSAYFLLGRE
jgi:CHAT domain-containing protein/tetratricopeptide (TPR) repeat protein